jgi:hypothetical protein
VSNADRPELVALLELERVLQHVKDELASWRRRALKAEAEQAEPGEHDGVVSRERILDLETENREMADRLHTARARVEDLVTRLKFLEEQVRTEEQGK